MISHNESARPLVSHQQIGIDRPLPRHIKQVFNNRSRVSVSTRIKK